MSLVVTAAASLATRGEVKFQWLGAVKLPQGDVYARRSADGTMTVLAIHRKDLVAVWGNGEHHACAVTIETYRDGEYESDHSAQAVGVWHRLETVNLAEGPRCIAYDLVAPREHFHNDTNLLHRASTVWYGEKIQAALTAMCDYLTDAAGGLAVLRPVPGKTTRQLRACARSLLRDGYAKSSLMQLRPDRIRAASSYVAYQIDGIALPLDEEIIAAIPQVAYLFEVAGGAPAWGVTAPLPHLSDGTTQRYLIARSGEAIVAAPLRMGGFTSAWHPPATEEHIWDQRIGMLGDAEQWFTTTPEALLAYCEYVHIPPDAIEKARRRGRKPTGYGRYSRAIVAFNQDPARSRIDSGDPERGELRYREGDAVRVAINPKLIHDMLSNVPSQAPLLIATSAAKPSGLYLSVANWGAVVMGLERHSDYDSGVSGIDYNKPEVPREQASPATKRRRAR